MKQNQIDAKIRLAFERDFERAAPDVLDSILEKTERHISAPAVEVVQTSRTASVVRRTALMAAAILLVLGMAFVLTAMQSGRTYSTMYIDVDECITLSLNRDGKLVSAAGSGAGTRRIAKALSYGAAADKVVETVIRQMLDEGSLSPACNTVLVTAVGGDSETGDTLCSSAAHTARSVFDQASFNGAVMSCTGSDDPQVLRISRDYRISVGKAMMVNDIITADRSQSIAALSKLSINDLSLIASMIPAAFRQIGIDGEPSVFSLDGLDIAKETVLRDLSLSEHEVDGIDLSCGADEDGLLYFIRVRKGGVTYTYKLSAQTAEIIHIMKSDKSGTHLLYERPSPVVVKPTANTKAEETASPTLAPGEIYFAAPVTDEVRPDETVPAETRAETPKPPVNNAQRATDAPEPSPAPVIPHSPLFDSDRYHLIESKSGSIPDSAVERAFSQIENSYDAYYTAESYPFASSDGVYALVTSAAQFKSLTGCTDERFDDGYFERHALIVIMDKEVDLHYVRRIRGVYTDSDTLYIDEAPRVGLYSKDVFQPRVNTILYELDRGALNDIATAVRISP